MHLYNQLHLCWYTLYAWIRRKYVIYIYFDSLSWQEYIKKSHSTLQNSMYSASISQPKQTRHKDSMLGQCWPAVYNIGPTLAQHWVFGSCLLRFFASFFNNIFTGRRKTPNLLHSFSRSRWRNLVVEPSYFVSRKSIMAAKMRIFLSAFHGKWTLLFLY